MFTRITSWKFGLLAIGLLIALSPAIALALTPVAGGILLEVLESPPPHAAPGGPTMPGTFPPGIGGRLAQATLVGSLAGIPLLTGEVELHAQSRVPFNPTTGWGVGTISGVATIDSDADGVLVAKLDGSLDFRLFNPTAANPLGVPLAPTGGTWKTLGKVRTGGSFAGVALVPFPCALGFGFCYLTVDAAGTPTGGVTALDANEFNKHGLPVAKFLITLFQ